MNHSIMFRHGKIYFPHSSEKNETMAMSIVSELMNFGYLPNENARQMMNHASSADLISFHNEIISYLKTITGSTHSYKPFWKGFPQEVMDKSEEELWLHQIIHYYSHGNYEPNEFTQTRLTAFEHSKYTYLDVGNENSIQDIFTSLVSINQSLTPQDLADISWIAKNYAVCLPKVIPFKENLCTLAALGLDVPIKSVTDVLRIAVHMSGGDISLPAVPPAKIKLNAWSGVKYDNPNRTAFKFKKFTRSERRKILGLFERTDCNAEEAVLKSQRFIKLGEILHPGEYKDKFPKTYDMFNKLRNTKVKSWYGKVDEQFQLSDNYGLNILSQRPGEFMRRLDYLVRTIDEDTVLSAFTNVAIKVSNKVLLEAYMHFLRRDGPVTDRKVMIKGSRKPTKLPDLIKLNSSTVENIKDTINSALIKKFLLLPELNNVWIDERLKNLSMPANMRSTALSLRPIVRGQRMPIGNQNAAVIRSYVHWFDTYGNEDLDLTATFVGGSNTQRIGWNGIKNSPLGCYSGDVRRKKGPCAEYIDVNIDEALRNGFQYVIFDVRNYQGKSLKTIKDCVTGCMEREHAVANEIFLPKTITNAFLLQSDSATTLTSMIDLKTREFIFLDIDQSGIPVASANANAILDAVNTYCKPPKFSIYDLLMLHVKARGKLTTYDEANIHFKFEDFAESYTETLKYIGV